MPGVLFIEIQEKAPTSHQGRPCLVVQKTRQVPVGVRKACVPVNEIESSGPRCPPAPLAAPSPPPSAALPHPQGHSLPSYENSKLSFLAEDN